MSDGKKMNEPVDPFSEYFRKRLADHPTPPDEMCWKEIDTQMQKKHRLSPMWISLTVVAASVLVAVFVLNHVITERELYPNIISEVKNSSGDECMDEERTLVQKEVSQKKAPSETISKHLYKDVIAETTPNQSVQNGSETISCNVEKKEEMMTNDTELLVESVNLPESSVTESPEKPQEQVVTETDEYAPPTDRKYAGRRQNGKHESLMAYSLSSNQRSGKSNGWQVSAGFASGGGLSALTSSNLVYDNAPGGNNTDPEYGKDPTNPENPDPGNPDPGPGDGEATSNIPILEEDIVDKTHSAPVSFGLTVRKMLNETIGIESGLIYTYLSTDFEMRGTSRYDASLKMHYLGLPVNLIVNISNRKPWNIYVSGGGMVEKGIHFVYKQSSYFSTGAQGKETGSVSGLQWSLNGGVGISYNLYRGINLYAEPGFSYYFDTDQPVSRRTDDPFNFNLRVGLRYDF